MGSQQSSAQPPTPQQSAQAQAMAQTAGTMYNIASSPTQAYAEALNQIQFNPIFQRVQSAANANSAFQNAQANQATQAASNPYGFAGQQAMNKGASMRLANMYGGAGPIGLTPMNTQGAFNFPSQGQLPDLNTIAQQSQRITNVLPTLKFNGETPMLNFPNQGGQQ